jgi:hypothetical protein
MSLKSAKLLADTVAVAALAVVVLTGIMPHGHTPGPGDPKPITAVPTHTFSASPQPSSGSGSPTDSGSGSPTDSGSGSPTDSGSGSPTDTSKACSPRIVSVSTFTNQKTQTVQIQGNCFGTGNTFAETDSASFRISDPSVSPEFNACYTGPAAGVAVDDFLGCTLTVWTDTSITFSGFDLAYGLPSAGGTYVVSTGEHIDIQVWNPQTHQGPAVCKVVVGQPGPTDCPPT